MDKCIKFLILPVIIQFLGLSKAHAIPNVIHLAGGVKFVCLDEIAPAKVIKSEKYKKLTAKQTKHELKLLNTKLKSLKKTLKKTKNPDKANTIQSKINTLVETIAGINACKKRELVNSCLVIGDNSESSNSIKPKIINGDTCARGDTFVVQVSVTDASGTSNCSGFLVTPYLAITAAHCFYDDNNLPSATRVKVTTAFDEYEAYAWDHPTYIFEGQVQRKDDYAFVLLKRAATGTRLVDVITTVEAAIVGEKTVIGGFGKDDEGFSGLLEAGFNEIGIVQEGLLGFYFDSDLFESNTCKGDSGGPLLVKRNGVWKAAGITSFGVKESCEVGDLSAFTNLSQSSFQSGLEDYKSFTGFK